MQHKVRIIGIDPGSRVTGFGVIDSTAARSTYVASGCIRTDTREHSARLHTIFVELRQLLAQHEPDELAIESVFMHRNADSALKLGQARGAALCACFDRNLGIHEYAPRAIKQAVAGKGGADKEQVAHMVKILLGLDQDLKPDASDALAIALCHAHQRTTKEWIRRAAGESRR